MGSFAASILPGSRASRSASDDDLARRAVGGRGSAFDELYRRHAPSAWRVASAVTVDPRLAGAAVSAGFVGALSVSRRATAGAFRADLLATTYSHSLEILASLAVDGQVPVTRPQQAAAAAGETQAAFLELPERSRAAIWLSEVEKVSPAAVGAVLGVSATIASSLVDRALRSLAAHLSGPLPSPLAPALAPVVAALPAGLAAETAASWRASAVVRPGHGGFVAGWLGERARRNVAVAAAGLLALGVVGLGIGTQGYDVGNLLARSPATPISASTPTWLSDPPVKHAATPVARPAAAHRHRRRHHSRRVKGITMTVRRFKKAGHAAAAHHAATDHTPTHDGTAHDSTIHHTAVHHTAVHHTAVHHTAVHHTAVVSHKGAGSKAGRGSGAGKGKGHSAGSHKGHASGSGHAGTGPGHSGAGSGHGGAGHAGTGSGHAGAGSGSGSGTGNSGSGTGNSGGAGGRVAGGRNGVNQGAGGNGASGGSGRSSRRTGGHRWAYGNGNAGGNGNTGGNGNGWQRRSGNAGDNGCGRRRANGSGWSHGTGSGWSHGKGGGTHSGVNAWAKRGRAGVSVTGISITGARRGATRTGPGKGRGR